jgi:hypothetical protein
MKLKKQILQRNQNKKNFNIYIKIKIPINQLIIFGVDSNILNINLIM